MPGDAVFKVAADVTEFVSQMSHAERATKRVGKATGDIGDKLTGSLIKVGVLKRALDAAGQAITNVIDKAQSASKSAGDRGISLATNLSRLGLDPASINRVSEKVARGSDVTTAEQGAALVKGLVSASKDRRSKLSGEDTQALIAAAISSGEFGFGEGFAEMLEGVSTGKPVADIVKEGRERAATVTLARTDAFSSVALGVRGRAAETQAQFTEEAAFRVAGTTKREEVAQMRETAAVNPGGLVSIVSGFSETAATELDAFKRRRDLESEQDAPQAVSNAANVRGGLPFNPSQSLGRAISDLTATFRKATNQPNLATDTP